ncbi:hypothetical protein LNV09_20545 [Paucibacter sp. B2R-40]|uniref:hypothetical protein n=1 Tax=Paucibacter sp. B2R-40 TaxID=2893554 RepID=UPI0021E3D3EE|nr:hypothetical protein [Paucibacter sp. B2R-40]MCV2356537.1 hypothetical protein [Paucibacter sp. B2R-40]
MSAVLLSVSWTWAGCGGPLSQKSSVHLNLVFVGWLWKEKLMRMVCSVMDSNGKAKKSDALRLCVGPENMR